MTTQNESAILIAEQNQRGIKMKPMKINNQIRIVYDDHYDWVKSRGLAGKPINDLVFDDYLDAWAWLDKFNDLRGQI